MSNTTVTADDLRVAIRLSPELAARIDAYETELRTITPGLTITRSDAIRSLLELALRSHEKGGAR